MVVIKGLILLFIFASAVLIGLAFANTYKQRTDDLKSMRNILNIFETKIKYTYEPLPQIFEDISKDYTGSISNIFKISISKMNELSAGEAWEYALDNSTTSMNKEDINVLKNLGKLLGKTNIDGQLSEIELIKEFIDVQINKAEEEQRKNEKMYKNLGVIIGLALVIILI